MCVCVRAWSRVHSRLRSSPQLPSRPHSSRGLQQEQKAENHDACMQCVHASSAGSPTFITEGAGQKHNVLSKESEEGDEENG